MRTLSIDIWSDIMCPWCLVGWGNLSQALARLGGEIAGDIRWHAFELNPDMPPEGEDRTAHIARKYGRTRAQSEGVEGRMRDAARAAGVSLAYDGPQPAPPAMMWNTFAAHRLLAWAGETLGSGPQTALKLALFSAHFNHRRPIGDEGTLLAIAGEQGIDRQAAALALTEDRWAVRVREDERAAADLDIAGVPAMVIAGTFMVPGAQGAESYEAILRRVASRIGAPD